MAASAYQAPARDLVDLVGRFVELRRSGTRFIALCPFHQEHDPSFKVDPERQRWKCWGCGRWGDAWDFLRLIGQPAGVFRVHSQPPREPLVMTADMRQAVGVAAALYVREMETNRAGRRYLRSRGFSAEDLGASVGYAPGWNRTVDVLRRHGLEQAGLRVGLVAQGKRGLYDVFRGRVVFVEERAGEAVYLIARALRTDVNVPRYLYLRPPAPLYGVRGAMKRMQQCAGRPWCLTVEGVTDALALQQLGAPAIAMLGSDPSQERFRELEQVLPGETTFGVLGDSDRGGDQLRERMHARFQARVVSLPALRVVNDPGELLLLGAESRLRVLQAVLASANLRLEEKQ